MGPPDPDREWTAEVEWSDEDGEARFRVSARADDGEAVHIASSAPVAWPPPDAAAVERLSRVATRLESAMVAAGWTPLPPGDAWYAKRFAWAAAASPVPRDPAPPLPRDAAPPRTRRFARQEEWPPETEDLWRCEVRWRPGYVTSRFEAVAIEPDGRRAATVCRSDPFKWLFMADPLPGAPEYVAGVRRVAERLAAAGWEPASRGPHWYQLRFVWRRDGAPPEHLELEPAEAADG